MANSISFRGTLSIHSHKCAVVPRRSSSQHCPQSGPLLQHHFKNPLKASLVISSTGTTTTTAPSMALVRSLFISPPSDPPLVDASNETDQCYNDHNHKPHFVDCASDEMVMMRELEELMKRVERVKETMKAREYVEKFLGKNGVGEVSDEDMMIRDVEVMVGDVVERFWEKPIHYLRNGVGRLEDRMKDLERIVGIFEQTCLDHGKGMTSKGRKQCPFHQSKMKHN